MKLISKDRTPTTLLGLTLDGSRLEAVVLRRTNGSVAVQKSASATLTLDLFTNEAELVGREIRNALDAARIKERRCVVSLPASWALSLQTTLPELPDADVAGFLEIEAERGFPRGTDELQVCASRFTAPSGTRLATQLAVTREQLARLESVLEAAGLKPHGFSFGLLALPGAMPSGSRGVVAAIVGEGSVDVLVSSGGGVVALRSLEGAFEGESGEKRLQTDLVARELRITLGQLAPDIRANVAEMKIFGPGRHAEQLMIEMRPRAAGMGLLVEHVPMFAADAAGLKPPANTPVTPWFALAAHYLAARNGFEFLPPKPSMWAQLTERYSSRRLAWVGATAGAAAATVIGLFAWQQVTLTRLNAQWDAMKKPHGELDNLQKQVRKFRPWFDESHTSLSILRRVTESFPEDGSVAAKSFEIRNPANMAFANVSCTGTARDNPSLLKALDQLRAADDVSAIKVEVMKGKSPMQFTFNFHWGQKRKNEN
jgi:hypothetical protein